MDIDHENLVFLSSQKAKYKTDTITGPSKNLKSGSRPYKGQRTKQS